MNETLKNHIQKFITINEADLTEIFSYFTVIDADKKQQLITEGKICDADYFVSKGCLRLYFINEKGVEHTIEFALENWWLSDYNSFSSQQPSEYCIQAVERSEVFAISYSAREKMLSIFPQMERYFRIMQQRAHAAAQFRLKSLYTLSKEEFYRLFNDRHPEFVQRVPQYLLASFLGLTPEYLSEIRSKKIS